MSDAEVKGYVELQRAVDKIAKNFPRVTRETAINIARQWVSLAQAAAHTPQQGLAARALGVSTDTEGSTLTANSPIFFGAEFGGQHRPETMQFPPHQGKRGYFLFPTARANADRFNAQWVEAVNLAMKPWDHKE